MRVPIAVSCILLALSDVYAGAIEGPTATSRKAGFA